MIERRSGTDRRRYRRFSFVANADFKEAFEVESGDRIEATVTILAQRGCYLKTDRILPVGSATTVRIRKGDQTLDIRATVVYSKAGEGMGLEFDPLELGQPEILEEWLVASRENAWLTLGRRRSQRLMLRVKVRVSGHSRNQEPFEEETTTLVASPHGALVLLATPLSKGQRVTLTNVDANTAQECIITHIGDVEGDCVQIGVDFLTPNPTFWPITFPPEDWTPHHPDAKSAPAMSKVRRSGNDNSEVILEPTPALRVR
jgi:hypothetical protein